jgi:hypothetical protein
MLSDLKQFKDTGFVKKVKWLTARDEHVCPLCAAEKVNLTLSKKLKKNLKVLSANPETQMIDADAAL